VTSLSGVMRAAADAWRTHLQHCAKCAAARRNRTGKTGCDLGAHLLTELQTAETRLMQDTARTGTGQGKLWE
jgi:hypothetical protein